MDTEINFLQRTCVREGTELMSLSASQLMVTGTLMSELQFNEFDIFKNVGVQATMFSDLKGKCLDVGLSINEMLKAPAFEAGQALSRLVESSAFESMWHAQVHAQEILGSARLVEQLSAFNSANALATQGFARLVGVSHQISSQFSVFDGSIAATALQGATLSSVRAWENAATAFVKQSDAKQLLSPGAFGRGTIGVISAVTPLLPDFDDVVTDINDDRGFFGPALFAGELRKLLGSLDPRLPRRLDGAWEAASRRGPDSASQAAHSLMETIDWTLRLAAPESTVLAWHAAEGRSVKELHNGKPTRPLRVEWLVRGRPGEADAARLHLRVLGDLVSVIQSHKHSENEPDVAAVARLILTVESLLIFVLGVSPLGRDVPSAT